MQKNIYFSLVAACLVPQVCQAESYLNLFEINCLPEVGVLQIAPRPYPLSETELQKVYDDAQFKQNLEDKNFYYLKLNSASSIQKICHFKGYNVQADLQTVVCENGKINAAKKPCFDTSLNLKVGEQEIVKGLNLNQFSGKRDIVNVELKAIDNVRYALQIDYLLNVDGLSSPDDFPENVDVRLMPRYRVVYGFDVWDEGFVLDNSSFDGNTHSQKK